MAEPAQQTLIPSLGGGQPAAIACVTARLDRDGVVVTVTGEIDLSNISVLENELARHEQVPRVVIDLSAVEFCAVVGVRLLHVVALRLAATGRRFEVVDNPMIARVLRATDLADDVTRRRSL